MANFDLINLQVFGSKSLPTQGTQSIYTPMRGSLYGEPVHQSVYGSKSAVLADEGSLYVANNPTAGTGIVDTAALTSFSATTPTMVVYNGNAAGGKSIYLLDLRLNVTAAGTNGTNWSWAMYMDAGNRLSSGGSTLTATNANIASSNTSGATITFGAITATSATAGVRKVSAGPGRTVIKVVGDEYRFSFGDSTPATTGMPLEGTTQLHRLWQLPAVVIPPGYSFLFYEWAASQSVAAGFEVQLTYAER